MAMLNNQMVNLITHYNPIITLLSHLHIAQPVVSMAMLNNQMVIVVS